MVFCDRHYGGINYPVGGVGRIAEELAEGLRERGGHIEYRANVRPGILCAHEAHVVTVRYCILSTIESTNHQELKACQSQTGVSR